MNKSIVLGILLTIIAANAVFSANRKPRVAVLEFTAKSSVSRGESEAVGELFRNALVNSGEFDVVDRENMNELLREQTLQQTGCTETACAVKLGRILNVQYMFYGTLMKLGNSYYITAGMVNVETSQIVKSAQEQTPNLDNVLDVIRKMIGTLTGNPVRTGETPRTDARSSAVKIADAGIERTSTADRFSLTRFIAGADSSGHAFAAYAWQSDEDIRGYINDHGGAYPAGKAFYDYANAAKALGADERNALYKKYVKDPSLGVAAGIVNWLPLGTGFAIGMLGDTGDNVAMAGVLDIAATGVLIAGIAGTAMKSNQPGSASTNTEIDLPAVALIGGGALLLAVKILGAVQSSFWVDSFNTKLEYLLFGSPLPKTPVRIRPEAGLKGYDLRMGVHLSVVF